MKANDLLTHFLSIAPWVDPNDTVDKIIIGDPNKELSKILVAWQASLAVVQYAIDGDYDAIITHEPTFYFHSDELLQVENLPDDSARKKMALKKKLLIEDAGLVIIRNHDVWDRFPSYGILSAWAKQLGMPDTPQVNGGVQNMYTIAPIKILEYAAKVADRLEIDPRQIQVFGNHNKIISHVGIGAGCYCDIDFFAEMGCNALIVCDDGTSHWSELALTNDMDLPVIRVFHATSEEYGISLMAEYLQKLFNSIRVDYLPFDTKASFL